MYKGDQLSDSLHKAINSLCEEDIDVDEMVKVLDSQPILPQRFKVMETSDLPFHKLLPSIEVPPILELKQLPKHLRYIFLGLDDTLPIIISSELTILQKEKLIKILKDHKSAIAWTIADKHGIWCGCWSFSPG